MAESAVAGALYAVETVVEGAVALVKGITHPTLPLKSKLLPITSVPLPRSHHTISVVKGRAYIFGGEISAGQLADNAMQIVILPSSGVLEADYTSIPARGREVPAPRKGHTATVIGDSIYIFGGEGVSPEKGRIWVYSTISNDWSHIDPSSPDAPYPAHRSGHAAASSDKPGPKDVTYQEKAPQQPADPTKVVPEPADAGTWGTIFIVGGRDILNAQLLNDGLAFDLNTRAWTNIPTPPGPAREGASMTLLGNRLYRFGGKGVETFASGALQYVDVSHVWDHAKSGTTPLVSGWAWEEVPHPEGSSAPQARSNAGLVGVTTGQGRHYLLVIGGEGEGAGATFLDDIWAFQLPPEYGTAALVKDQMRASISKTTHVGEWAETSYAHVDDTGVEKEVPGQPKRGLGPRGGFAVDKGSEVDGASLVAWGGVDEGGKVLGDGWLVTVDR
jgi:hypothetical protein